MKEWIETQLKAKDEEIKRLNCRAYLAEGYISDLHNEYPKHKKFLNTKARSIVAMLFWEWRRYKELANGNSYYECLTEMENTAKFLFEQAYKKLKETK